jgi:hypothetical protein
MKFVELEVVKLLKDVEVTFTAGPQFMIPAGSKGTIVQVLGDPKNPAAYLVDVHHVITNQYGVATVPAEQLVAG